MKVCIAIMLVALLSAFGTIGGTVAGMGQDLHKAGEWVKNR